MAYKGIKTKDGAGYGGRTSERKARTRSKRAKVRQAVHLEARLRGGAGPMKDRRQPRGGARRTDRPEDWE